MEISKNVVCATSTDLDQPAHSHSLIRAFASYLHVVRLSSRLNSIGNFLSLRGGCIGSCKCIHDKMTHCWKSHVVAHTTVHTTCKYAFTL